MHNSTGIVVLGHAKDVINIHRVLHLGY